MQVVFLQQTHMSKQEHAKFRYPLTSNLIYDKDQIHTIFTEYYKKLHSCLQPVEESIIFNYL